MVENEKHIQLLLKKIEAGDESAFRTIYDYYYSHIYKFSSYYVKSSEILEEVVSDVFCIIWQNRKKLLDIDNLEGYIYTIAKNKALYYLSNKKKIQYTEVELELIHHELLINDKDPELMTIDVEFAVAFKNAVDKLPEKCRLIFLLAREEGLKYKEIAQKLSISEKTVNSQMVLAIKKLAKLLEKYLLLVVFLFHS